MRKIDHDLAACGIYSPEISSLGRDLPGCMAFAGGMSGSSPVCVVALERKGCENLRCGSRSVRHEQEDPFSSRTGGYGRFAYNQASFRQRLQFKVARNRRRISVSAFARVKGDFTRDSCSCIRRTTQSESCL
jgi:hypothetical protein